MPAGAEPPLADAAAQARAQRGGHRPPCRRRRPATRSPTSYHGHCPKVSSPPTPVSTEPPRASRASGTIMCAFAGNSTPWRRSPAAATGPTKSSSIAHLQPYPVADAEVGDHNLLPATLNCPFAVVLERDRHRLGPAFTPSERHRDRQQRRRVAAAREPDHAGRRAPAPAAAAPPRRRGDRRRAVTVASTGQDPYTSPWPARTPWAAASGPRGSRSVQPPPTQEPAPSKLSVWGFRPDRSAPTACRSR